MFLICFIHNTWWISSAYLGDLLSWFLDSVHLLWPFTWCTGIRKWQCHSKIRVWVPGVVFDLHVSPLCSDGFYVCDHLLMHIEILIYASPLSVSFYCLPRITILTLDLCASLGLNFTRYGTSALPHRWQYVHHSYRTGMPYLALRTHSLCHRDRCCGHHC